MGTSRLNEHLWIVGGGIAGMAAAAFAIRDAGLPGDHVHILEELGLQGGSLDGAASPVQPGAYVTRGGRMLEEEAYRCVWDLFSTIPSRDDPSISVKDEIRRFNERVKTHAKARLIDRDHRILDAADYGFSLTDRFDFLRLIATPEPMLGSKRIEELFHPHFFDTHFWQMWRTTFAFQRWHSAAELRRYFLRFIQEFGRIHTLEGVRRTVYNQYDSMVVPLQRWLLAQGAEVRFATRVLDVDFAGTPETGRRATRLHVLDREGEHRIELGPADHAVITLGSITADSTYGGNDTVPELIRDRRDHGWSLWENIARKAPDFGRPMTFFGAVDEHKWESFTLTMRDRVLLDRIVAYTGNEPGTGALMTWVRSGWHLSIVVPHQPHFPGMPEHTYTLWGYGFQVDDEGDYVRKPMARATGKEIVTELVHQLGFEDILDEVLAGTDVTSVMMPYASALFACRAPGDRPKVVPEGARNFAFLGQFVEIPEDVVFTVEYSVHAAMIAAYTLFGVDRPIPRIYRGLLDPQVAAKATRTLIGG
ncbi:oleate hydratase [Amycolatopsis rhizosphaerae]|uniref:Oleate hydratase n=1 Tax=Amycolatopsis rhizosphaerae TaxID=2053003 RepID=A0A558A9P9_9PSEU|nr:oleate hydratase [Amycolatopsis rhizosphaerae]TVT20974.1 oleate hydratase [Amycolatopsis rhizosphaerae]